jgi:hypothetical protein
MSYVHPRLTAGYALSPPPFSNLHSLAVWIGLTFVILWDVSGGDLTEFGGVAAYVSHWDWALPWALMRLWTGRRA